MAIKQAPCPKCNDDQHSENVVLILEFEDRNGNHHEIYQCMTCKRVFVLTLHRD